MCPTRGCRGTIPRIPSATCARLWPAHNKAADEFIARFAFQQFSPNKPQLKPKAENACALISTEAEPTWQPQNKSRQIAETHRRASDRKRKPENRKAVSTHSGTVFGPSTFRFRTR